MNDPKDAWLTNLNVTVMSSAFTLAGNVTDITTAMIIQMKEIAVTDCDFLFLQYYINKYSNLQQSKADEKKSTDHTSAMLTNLNAPL